MGDEWNRGNWSRTGLFEVDLAQEGLEDHPTPTGSSSPAGAASAPSRFPALFPGAEPSGPAGSSDWLAGDWQQELPWAAAAPFCFSCGPGKLRRSAGIRRLGAGPGQGLSGGKKVRSAGTPLSCWAGGEQRPSGGAVLPEGAMQNLPELFQCLWVFEEHQGSGGQQSFRSKQ